MGGPLRNRDYHVPRRTVAVSHRVTIFVPEHFLMATDKHVVLRAWSAGDNHPPRERVGLTGLLAGTMGLVEGVDHQPGGEILRAVASIVVCVC
jgi:hypothetical protein